MASKVFFYPLILQSKYNIKLFQIRKVHTNLQQMAQVVVTI